MSTLKLNNLEAATGTTINIASGDKLTGAAGSISAPGHVIQVVQAVKTDRFSTTSASAVDVTGLTVDITPRSSSNKVLVSCSLNYGGDTNFYGGVLLKRGSTTISAGTDATGSQSAVTLALGGDNENFTFKVASASIQFLDSPSTTSATTYKIQIFSPYNSEPFVINSSNSTADQNYIFAGTSTITVMEIAQ